jgi:hypothetical protein
MRGSAAVPPQIRLVDLPGGKPSETPSLSSLFGGRVMIMFGLSAVSRADETSDLTHQSRLEYDSIIGTGSPDLDRFNGRGGKIITWHGHADPIIPP